MTEPAVHSRFWHMHYGLDLRSLAVLRVGLAIVTTLALVTPLGELISNPGQLGGVPIPNWLWVGGRVGLLGGAIAIGLALLVGYKTRLVVLIAWGLVTVLLPPNSGFGAILGFTLLGAMFLPLGACYAIDSAMNTHPPPLPPRFWGPAVLAMMLQQWAIVGFWAGRLDLAAIATPLGQGLIQLGLLPWLDLGLRAWVGLLPVLLLLPVWAAARRIMLLAIALPLAVTLGLAFQLGLLPLLSLVVGLAFIPTSVWASWSQRCYGPEQAGLVIYYDADCGFCKKVVHLIRTFLALPQTPLRQAQSDPVICAAMERQNSWVVVDSQGQQHYKFAAIAYVCALSPLGWWLAPGLRWAPVLRLGTRVYEAIANHRRQAGYLTRPLQFHAVSVEGSRHEHWLAAVLLIGGTLWYGHALLP